MKRTALQMATQQENPCNIARKKIKMDKMY